MTDTSTALALVPPPGAGLTEEQKAILADKLSADFVKTRDVSGSQVAYIEAWRAIDRANEIFGFDAWTRETVHLERTVAETYEKPGYQGRPAVQMWRVGYLARVRVSVAAGGRVVVREGTGYGTGSAQDPNAAYEGAVKEAESDAMKRALMTWGNQFGLTLYDKTKADVGTPDYVVRAEFAAVSPIQARNLRELLAATSSDEEKLPRAHPRRRRRDDPRHQVRGSPEPPASGEAQARRREPQHERRGSLPRPGPGLARMACRALRHRHGVEVQGHPHPAAEEGRPMVQDRNRLRIRGRRRDPHR